MCCFICFNSYNKNNVDIGELTILVIDVFLFFQQLFDTVGVFLY